MQRFFSLMALSLCLVCSTSSTALLPAQTAPGKKSPAAQQYIYLSFDDGPLKGSEHIDSVVLAEKLKINVFLVGEHALKSKELGQYAKMYQANPYVEAYNHSFTHANDHYALFYQSPENVLADIRENEKALDLRFKIVRLPGRNMWRLAGRKKDDGTSGAAAADLLAANGYRLYGWDLEWNHQAKDGKPVQSVDEMVKAIQSRLAKGNSFTPNHVVVLIHDEMFQTTWEESQLKQLIDRLRALPNLSFEHLRFYPNE